MAADSAGQRIAVPTRRPSVIIGFWHAGNECEGQVSYLPDGRPVEVFLEVGTVGSSLQSMARDAAVVVSLALQFGAGLLHGVSLLLHG